MQTTKYPFSVRLIGFSPVESGQLAALLAQAPDSGPAYSCLHDDSLQEPDLFLANGDHIPALARLASMNPSAIQPAAIIGDAVVDLPLPQLQRPLRAATIFPVLANMVEQRADALANVTSIGWPAVPERRRRERIDFDLTDQSVYTSKRRAPQTGAVLVVDQGDILRDRVVKLLGKRKLPVESCDSASDALRLCIEQPVSVVLVNGSAPGIDPYSLCSSIKALPNGAKIAVVFLVDAAFPYNSVRARAAGARGLLDKPVADRHLLGSLQKLLSLPL
jgi:CheY-like chemotaxis protein